MSERGFLSRLEQPYNLGRRSRSGPCFYEIATAPFNRPVMIEVDNAGDCYALPFLCIQTADGWVSARTRKPLLDTLIVIGWKR